jgi:hypothetical protein
MDLPLDHFFNAPILVSVLRWTAVQAGVELQAHILSNRRDY